VSVGPVRPPLKPSSLATSSVWSGGSERVWVHARPSRPRQVLHDGHRGSSSDGQAETGRRLNALYVDARLHPAASGVGGRWTPHGNGSVKAMGTVQTGGAHPLAGPAADKTSGRMRNANVLSRSRHQGGQGARCARASVAAIATPAMTAMPQTQNNIALAAEIRKRKKHAGALVRELRTFRRLAAARFSRAGFPVAREAWR
jgi:hypothetical protein